MKTLENWFHRGPKNHRIYYKVIMRNENAGLFQLFIKEPDMEDYGHVGWEVSKIISREETELFGHTLEAKEVLIGDDKFGFDGSKAFFPYQQEEAMDYYLLYSQKPLHPIAN